MTEISETLLAAKGLTYTLVQEAQPLKILDHLDLQVKRGERLAIVGPSGAGKSTLLAILAGLDVPTDGELTWAGKPFSQLDEDARAAIRAQEVGFIFQSFQLLPELTALENVALPLELRGDKTAQTQAAYWLEQVGLSPRARHRPAQLSGGEQQRVAIARAFVTGPSVLFADEPTGNLDQANGKRVADLLFDLTAATRQEHPATLILVTHDRQLAARCDRQLYLEAGQLQESSDD